MLQRIEHEGVIELKLVHPPANALRPSMLSELTDEIEASQSSAAGFVLSGLPGFFSGGLDVPYLLACERPEIEELWKTFVGTMRAIAHCERPIAAAITGHAPAGGTILALFCDHRVMVEGPFRLGLNEVQIGLPVPRFLYDALGHLVGTRLAEQMITSGALIEAEQAQAVGLVDEVVSPHAVVNTAIEWVREMAMLPTDALRMTRETVRRTAFASLDSAIEPSTFADRWYSPETQAAMKALAAKLS